MLAEVTTTSEMTFLRTNANRYGKTFWLGGSDQANEGVWLWTTSGQRFTVTDWHTRTVHEPNNQDGNENCLTIDDELDNEWNDDKCSFDYRFICERPLIDLSYVATQEETTS
ncbi:perlucin-like [Mytilus trossulus]|uniref:perlucin-like n=1 Tax=Mytilus trossulus TaxID=6551 RepID=UPI0030064521